MSDDYVPREPVRQPDGATGPEPGSDTDDADSSGHQIPPLREVAEISRPSTLGGVLYLVVLVGALAGVVVAAAGPWRTGISWLALSLLGGAAARLAIAEDNAGMLRVRRKYLDIAVLAGLGVLLLVLAGTIPDQPVAP